MRGGARHVADRRPDAPGTSGGVAVADLDPADRPAADRPARHPGRRPLVWVAWGVAGLVVVAGGLSAAAVWRLQANIHAVDVTRQLGTDRPTAAPADAKGDQPLNVLVLGSDSRDGSNSFVGGKKDEGRSDTTLVLHLSADRRRAVAVSIPRDSVVPMPTCTDRAGAQHPGAERQFNDAYTIGGVGCTQRTVEQLTGLRIDHYVVVDFAGFRDMVDALGTVPICLPKAVNDTRHHISLPAGRSRVDGVQALSYVRERYALGDGGDLGRIDRQQAFISSVLQEATSAGTLTDPPKLYAFLNAATRSVTMDPDLAGLGSLTSLAGSVAKVGLRNIQFVTVPNEPYEPDPNRLQWAPSARGLWRALRQDAPITFAGHGRGSTPSPSPSASASASPSGGSGGSEAGPGAVDPGTVRVRVLNASGTPGAATAAADDLRAGGWQVVGVGDADGTGPGRTRIRYGTSATALRRAQALAALLPGAELVRTAGIGSTLQLEVGSDWNGLQAPSAGSSGGPGASPSGSAAGSPGVPVVVAGAEARTADRDICAATS